MSSTPDFQSFDLPESDRVSITRAIGAALRADSEIAFAYLHGSFLESRPFRDIDLAVYLDPPPNGPAFPYEQALCERLESAIGRGIPVDVRLANGAPISFLYHAFRGKLVLDRNPDLRVSVTAWVVGRYLDTQPLLAHFGREAFQRESRS